MIAIYLLQASLFVTAWFLRYESDLTIIALFAVLSLLAIGLLHWRPVRWRGGSDVASRQRSRRISHAATPDRWLREPAALAALQRLFIISVCIALYFVSVAIVLEQPSGDVQWMAAAIALGVLARQYCAGGARKQGGWRRRHCILALVMAVYFDRQTETFLEQTSPPRSRCSRCW